MAHPLNLCCVMQKRLGVSLVKAHSLIATYALAIACGHQSPILRVQSELPGMHVLFVSDEADAALAILELRNAGRRIPDEMWNRLFASEGYQNLRLRELEMRRPFTDSAFRSFIESDTLLARLPALRRALEEYRGIDVANASARALRYLPDGASLRSRLYLEIKPRTNSFVFQVPGTSHLPLRRPGGDSGARGAGHRRS